MIQTAWPSHPAVFAPSISRVPATPAALAMGPAARDFAPSSADLPSGTRRSLDVPHARGSDEPRVPMELCQVDLGGDPGAGVSENAEEGPSRVPRARSAVGGHGDAHWSAAPDGSEHRRRSQVSNFLELPVAAERRVRGYKIGDMVWGKVKSHPWWPGQVFNEAFASPFAMSVKVEGHVLVAFFGDGSYGWFDPFGDKLLPFEPHFAEKSTLSKLSDFLTAVDEAVDEVSRRGALTIACGCRTNIYPADVVGYVKVDVAGYEDGGIYSIQQIRELRSSFGPAEMLSFVRKLALMPQESEPKTLDFTRNKGVLFALRRRVFQERDEPYAEAFGVKLQQLSQSAAGDQLGKSAIQGGGRDSAPKRHRSQLLLKRKEEATAADLPKALHPVRRAPPHPRPPSSKHNASAVPEASDLLQKKLLTACRPDAGKLHSGTEKPPKPKLQQTRRISAAPPVGQRFVHGMIKKVQVPKAPLPEDMKVDYVRKMKRKVPRKDNEDGEHIKKAQVLKPRMEGLLAESVHPVKKKKTIVEKGPLNGAATHHPPHRDQNVKKSTEKFMGIRSLRAEEARALVIPEIDETMESSPDYATCTGAKHHMKSAGKSIGIRSIPVEEAKMEVSIKDEETAPTTDFSPDPATSPADQDSATSDLPILGVPQLVSDLLALATDPFHGADSGLLSVVSKSILKYRSLVFLMSLPSAQEKKIVLTPPISDPEGEEEKKDPTPIHPEPKPQSSKQERSQPLEEQSAKKASLPSAQGQKIVPTPPASVPEGAEEKKDPAPIHPEPKPQSSKRERSDRLEEQSAKKASLPSAQEQKIVPTLPVSAPEGAEEKKNPTPIHPEPKLQSSKRERSERLKEQSAKKAKKVKEQLAEKKKALVAGKKPERAVVQEQKIMPTPPVSAPEGAEEKKDPTPIHPEPKPQSSKRERSERLEVQSAKKAKRVEQVREQLTEKKKALVGEKKAERAAGNMGSALVPSRMNQLGLITPAKQQEKPQVKAPSPTFVMMKFPDGAALPSMSTLKAKFGRFGPLDISGIRIYGNTSTCKVLFKHWPDAMDAYNHVRARDFFGSVKVVYSVKGAPAPLAQKAEASASDAWKFRPASGGTPAAKPNAKRPSSVPLSWKPKSCLKKPEDEGGAAVKEGSRVRFADWSSPTALFTDAWTGGPSSPAVVPAPLHPPGWSQPPAPRPGWSQPPAPRPLLQTNGGIQRAPPQTVAGRQHPSVAAGRRPADPRLDMTEIEQGRGPSKVDISSQFMSLLVRCGEVVSVVRSLPGYRPYLQL